MPSGTSQAMEPFQTVNGNPWTQPAAAPAWVAGLLEEDESWRIGLEHSMANVFVVDETATESSTIDGEIAVTSLFWRYRLTPLTEVALTAPWIRHGGGIWDSTIDRWHDWFSLPDGGRDPAQRNQLRYRYVREGTVWQFDNATEGPGDIRLAWRQQPGADQMGTLLQFELSLPTGDADRLTGCECWQLAGGTSQAWQTRTSLGPLSTFVAAGLQWRSPSELPGDEWLQDWTASVRAGAALAFTTDWQLQLQLDSHTPLYDSDLTELGGIPAQLTTGLTYRLSSRWSAGVAFAEDLHPTASPDFVTLVRVIHHD